MIILGVPKTTVKDVMTPEPICVEGSTSLRALAAIFEQNEISGVPVVGNGGRLVGIVSKTDLVHHALQRARGSLPAYYFEMMGEELGEEVEASPEEEPVVQDIMSDDPVTARVDERATEVAQRLVEARVHRAVVLDRQHCPIGVVTSLDLLRVLASLKNVVTDNPAPAAG